MAFSTSTITEGPLYARSGGDLQISWASSSPDGTVFQLYADGRLIWSGSARSVRVPAPAQRTLYQVGTVPASEAWTDLGPSLPAVPGGSAGVGPGVKTITWQGGTYLDTDTASHEDVAGFNVYGETTPGGGISYAGRIAYIPAYNKGIILDGWGVGGWGQGGWGRAASSYSYTTEPLSAGTWNFAVKTIDQEGNESDAATAGIAVAAPPRPPAASLGGLKLTYTYSSSTHVATLNWLASPG